MAIYGGVPIPMLPEWNDDLPPPPEWEAFATAITALQAMNEDSSSSIPGVVGDGVTDDTVALQAYLTAHTGEDIFIPEGTYLISKNASGGLQIPSNTTLYLHPKAVFKAAVMAWGDHGLFSIYDKTNVKIFGGELDGQKSLNAAGRVYGVYVRDSSHVICKYMYVHSFPAEDSAGGNGGDAFLVRGASGGSTNVTIENNRIDDCVRQGISVSKTSGIRILNNRITNITGTNPGGGIDVEPDGGLAANFIKDGLIAGNTIDTAYKGIILDGGSDGVISEITVRDNTIRAAKFSHIRFTAGGQDDSWGISIVDNKFISTNNEVTNNPGMVYMENAGTGTVLQRNTFVGFGDTASAFVPAALVVEASRMLEISSNYFLNCPKEAILVSAVGGNSNPLVMNNRTLACGTPSTGSVFKFTLDGGSISSARIKNNTLIETRTPAAASGFDFDGLNAATVGGFVVEDNNISSTITTLYANVPAGTGIVRIKRVGSAALNFDLTAVEFQDLTITVTGVLVAGNNAVALSVPNASIADGVSYMAWVSADNTATVRATRTALATPNPASGTFVAVVTTTN